VKSESIKSSISSICCNYLMAQQLTYIHSIGSKEWRWEMSYVPN
jgi:hypothetical protein